MAQLVRLILSAEDKKLVERPSVVAERYLKKAPAKRSPKSRAR
jgi:hypothetical protein